MANGASVIRFYRPDDPFGELTNYYVCNAPFTFGRWRVRSSEHGYHADKYNYPCAEPQCSANARYADVIAHCKTPHQAKFLAHRRVGSKFLWQRAYSDIVYDHPDARPDPNWTHRSMDVMLAVLRAKFSANEHCRAVLLSTEDAILVENSPIDAFWGVGKDGNGQNWLGKLLMQVREELKSKLVYGAQQLATAFRLQ